MAMVIARTNGNHGGEHELGEQRPAGPPQGQPYGPPQTPPPQGPQQPRWAWWVIGIVIPVVGILITILVSRPGRRTTPVT